jgi:hypothetical protein
VCIHLGRTNTKFKAGVTLGERRKDNWEKVYSISTSFGQVLSLKLDGIYMGVFMLDFISIHLS